MGTTIEGRLKDPAWREARLREWVELLQRYARPAVEAWGEFDPDGCTLFGLVDGIPEEYREHVMQAYSPGTRLMLTMARAWPGSPDTVAPGAFVWDIESYLRARAEAEEQAAQLVDRRASQTLLRDLQGITAALYREGEQHPCRAVACTTLVAADLLMCHHHWCKVPKAMKSAVWRTWRECRPDTLTREYVSAVLAAVLAVAHAEGRLPRGKDGGIHVGFRERILCNGETSRNKFVLHASEVDPDRPGALCGECVRVWHTHPWDTGEEAAGA